MQRDCGAGKEKILLARAKDSCITLKSHDDEIGKSNFSSEVRVTWFCKERDQSLESPSET
jgi:hypothetical protein